MGRCRQMIVGKEGVVAAAGTGKRKLVQDILMAATKGSSVKCSNWR